MTCKECGTVTSSEDKFCRNCGKDLTTQSAQPQPISRATPGKFHRASLAIAIIWTCYLLGVLIAFQSNLVGHGTTDHNLSVLGLGLSFIFFGGLWFVGTVVFLLVALATKPSTSIQWPTRTKWITAGLSILALAWPISSVIRRPQQSTSVTLPVAPPTESAPSAVPSDHWRVSQDTSPMDGSETVTLDLDSEDSIQGWVKSEKPTLIIRCKENRTEVYVVTGMAASVEFGTEGHTVRTRLDDRKPVSQRWSDSTDHKALFAPNPIPLAKRLANAKKLAFEFTPFEASPAIAEFDLTGLESHLGKVASACGWRVPEKTDRRVSSSQRPPSLPKSQTEKMTGRRISASPTPQSPSPSSPTPPPPPKPKVVQRIRVDGQVEAAKLIYNPAPEYPSLAKMARIQGKVRLEVIISKDGTIQDLKVLNGHPLLVKAALDAVKQWRYQQTLLSGEPVEVVTDVDVDFTLPK